VETHIADIKPELEKGLVAATAAMEAGQGALGAAEELIDTAGAHLKSATGAVAQAANAARDVLVDVKDGHGILGQLVSSDGSAKDLSTILVNLAAATERVADTPSILIWDRSKDEQARAKAKREQAIQQRHYQEGFDLEPEPALAPVDETAVDDAAEADSSGDSEPPTPVVSEETSSEP
jgi:hypothetical protein